MWVEVMQDIFNEELPDYHWIVDDPGTLYTDDLDDEFEDVTESPFNIDLMQKAADKALERYSQIFDTWTNDGVPVVNSD